MVARRWLNSWSTSSPSLRRTPKAPCLYKIGAFCGWVSRQRLIRKSKAFFANATRSSIISQKTSRSPWASIAIRGKLTVTTPKFIRPLLTSSPSAFFQACKKLRQPMGALKFPVNSTILSYIKTSGYIRLVAHSTANCLIS